MHVRTGTSARRDAKTLSGSVPILEIAITLEVKLSVMLSIELEVWILISILYRHVPLE